MRTIGLTCTGVMARVLEARGAQVVAGDDPEDLKASAGAVAAAVRSGDVDGVLLLAPDETSAGMLQTWLRTVSAGSSVKFVGVGRWEGAVSLEPGCSLADVLEALGLEPLAGDADAVVEADGRVHGHVVVGGPGGEEQEGPVGPWGASDPGRLVSGEAGRPGWRPGRPVESKGRQGSKDFFSSPWSAAVARCEPAVAPAPASAAAQVTAAPADGTRSRAGWGNVGLPGSRALDEAHADSDWGNVVFLVAGRGGVGRTSLGINIAEQAVRRHDKNVVLVDAAGGLAPALKVMRDGATCPPPTIGDLAAGASAQQVVSGPEDIRRAGGAAVSFASVFAPDPEQPRPEASRYLRVIDLLAPLSDLVVVDTPVIRERNGLATGLLAPGLRAGASALVLSDASLEGVDSVCRLVPWLQRLAPGRVTGVLSIMPVSALPDQAVAGKLIAPVPCLAVVPYDESVRLRAAKGQPVHRLLGAAASKVLAHLGVA